jgi:hypothetical protein
MNRLLYWGLVVPLAAVVVFFLVGFMLFVISLASPAASALALGILALAAVWFFVVRRKSAGVVSEASLMGRQSSTEGLL